MVTRCSEAACGILNENEVYATFPEPEKFWCPLCERTIETGAKMYRLMDQLREHVMHEHPGVALKWICAVCHFVPRGVNRLRKVKLHYATYHTDDFWSCDNPGMREAPVKKDAVQPFAGQDNRIGAAVVVSEPPLDLKNIHNNHALQCTDAPQKFSSVSDNAWPTRIASMLATNSATSVAERNSQISIQDASGVSAEKNSVSRQPVSLNIDNNQANLTAIPNSATTTKTTFVCNSPNPSTTVNVSECAEITTTLMQSAVSPCTIPSTSTPTTKSRRVKRKRKARRKVQRKLAEPAASITTGQETTNEALTWGIAARTLLAGLRVTVELNTTKKTAAQEYPETIVFATSHDKEWNSREVKCDDNNNMNDNDNGAAIKEKKSLVDQAVSPIDVTKATNLPDSRRDSVYRCNDDVKIIEGAPITPEDSLLCTTAEQEPKDSVEDNQGLSLTYQLESEDICVNDDVAETSVKSGVCVVLPSDCMGKSRTAETLNPEWFVKANGGCIMYTYSIFYLCILFYPMYNTYSMLLPLLLYLFIVWYCIMHQYGSLIRFYLLTCFILFYFTLFDSIG